ncbi:MAG TPA: ELWxxDGT repeat protein, partial [Pirellulales bacterium]|nr:ELWxxDGT repeat protein [Pirellulales bacterium]
MHFELLEPRLMLSGSPVDDPPSATDDSEVLTTSATVTSMGYQATDATDVATPFFAQLVDSQTGLPLSSSGPKGLTPTQILTAYGINQIKFAGGTITGDGSGQTIAIVDAYDDPNIASDLHAFDVQFGIADPPSFLKVSQTGSTTVLPGTDPAGPGDSWAVEISLDVEWAHAIAPKANILLVEATTNSNTNLYAAVDYARNYAGVSVVSMSWGGGESSSEVTSNDTHFATPAGHTGVTFVASTGDKGEPGGYPAFSSDVVAVGGTTLTLSGNNYSSESGWSGSGGGISVYESQPSYQAGIVTQSTTQRTIPDVSFDADPTSGAAVYDSWDYGSATPWAQIGGTSFSAPSWAALIAIADQGRASAGLGALDGPSQTLPRLYELPSTDFHDITTGNNGFAAGPGYDLVTGRGSPIANLLVADLVNMSVVAATPAAGGVVSTPPADFVVDFSDPYDPASIDINDITVNSFTPDSFTLTNNTTVTYHFNTSPVTSIGLQTFTMSNGAVTRLSDGGSVGAYNGAFRYDPHPIHVTSTTPTNGGVAVLPTSTLVVNFSEAFDPSSIGISDLALSQGTVIGFTVLNSTSVQYQLSGVTNEGILTVTMVAGAVTDAIGDPNLGFSGSYYLDINSVALPTPTAVIIPNGSLIYSTQVSTYDIGYAGDTDSFTLAVDAGQTISVVLTSATTLQAQIDVTGGIESIASAASRGFDVVVQPVVVTSTGTYTVTVSGLSGSTGAYNLQVILNAAIETEPHNGSTNATLATAQSITSSFISLGGNASRGAVVGTISGPADQDWYRLSLTAGDTVSVAASASTGGPLSIQLRDASGAVLGNAVDPSGVDVDELINDYTVSTSGTYYVLVTGSAAANYALVVARNAEFDDHANNSLTTAQSVLSAVNGGTQQVLGSITGTGSETFENSNDLANYIANGVDNAVLSSAAAHDGSLGLQLQANAGPGWIYRDDPAAEFTEGETLTAWVRSESTLTGGASIAFGASATGALELDLFGTINAFGINEAADYSSLSTSLGWVNQTFASNHWYKVQIVWGTDGTVVGKLYDTNGTTLLNTVTVQESGITGGGIGFRGFGNNVDIDSVTWAPTTSETSTYAVQMAAGGTLQASTATPGDGIGEPQNVLDPKLLVYNSAGVLVASDDNSGTDGRNASLTYQATAGGTYYIQVVASPLTQAPTSGNYVLSVSGNTVVAPPSTVGIADQQFAENGSDVIDLRSLFSDAAFGVENLTFSVTADSNTSLAYSFLNNSAGTLQLVGRTNQLGSAQLTVQATDAVGNAISASFHTYVVDGVNTPPAITVPATQVSQINVPVVFTASAGDSISVSDSDGNVGNEQLSLTVSHGTLTLGTTAGLASVVGDGTTTVALIGTLTNLNAALNGLVYTPDAEFVGTAQLQIVDNDQGNVGSGGAMQASQTVLIQVRDPALQLAGDANTTVEATSPTNMVTINNFTYFVGTDSYNGPQVWKTDGTAAGTSVLADAADGTTAPANLTAVGNTLFFTANGNFDGVELWKSDGTEDGTVEVDDIDPGIASSTPSNLTNVNGTLFFTANDGTHGTELWKSDGTAAGTVMVADIRTGSASSAPDSLTNVNGELFFRAGDGTHGAELWKSDGTAAGTVMVEDINGTSSGSGVASLTSFNGVLYFAANNGVNGLELWTSDGTTSGTMMVKDIRSGSGGSGVANLIVFNGSLYFTAADGTHGTELWKSDGTTNGTALFDNIAPGSSASSPANFFVLGNTLYFSATDTTNGVELWKTDGTVAGTSMVSNIASGSASSSPSNFVNFNGTLVFSATDGTHGVELWKSDGTAAGTV